MCKSVAEGGKRCSKHIHEGIITAQKNLEIGEAGLQEANKRIIEAENKAKQKRAENGGDPDTIEEKDYMTTRLANAYQNKINIIEKAEMSLIKWNKAETERQEHLKEVERLKTEETTTGEQKQSEDEIQQNEKKTIANTTNGMSRIDFSVTQQEWAEIGELASEQDLTVSEYIRQQFGNGPYVSGFSVRDPHSNINLNTTNQGMRGRRPTVNNVIRSSHACYISSDNLKVAEALGNLTGLHNSDVVRRFIKGIDLNAAEAHIGVKGNKRRKEHFDDIEKQLGIDVNTSTEVVTAKYDKLYSDTATGVLATK